MPGTAAFDSTPDQVNPRTRCVLPAPCYGSVPNRSHRRQIHALGKDPYKVPYPGLPGATVRLVLGAGPDWQSPTAGHKFVTDAKGEARFTMDGLLDSRWRSRPIGFTPFSMPTRAEHMQIALEVDHEFPLNGQPPKTFRWVLTMDLDCFRDGQCSTVDFMSIYTPDSKGRFTKLLPRQGSTESWKVQEFNGLVIFGMSYQVADFMLSSHPDNPKKRTLSLALKKLHRQAVQ